MPIITHHEIRLNVAAGPHNDVSFYACRAIPIVANRAAGRSCERCGRRQPTPPSFETVVNFVREPGRICALPTSSQNPDRDAPENPHHATPDGQADGRFRTSNAKRRFHVAWRTFESGGDWSGARRQRCSATWVACNVDACALKLNRKVESTKHVGS